METIPETLTTRPPLPPEPPDEVEIAALGERIAELSALLTATEYQLLTLIREFDERIGWRGGFRSCAHWLNWRTGLAMGAAREKVRVAKALAELPLISAAMRDGEVSFSKVRALTRVANPSNEESLLAFAHAGPAAHVERLVRAWRSVEGRDDRKAEAERHASRHLALHTDDDGMVTVRGRLDAETGAALARALEAAEQELFDETTTKAGNRGRGPSASQRRADAVGRVAEAALAGGLDQGTRGERYQVVLHVEVPSDGTCQSDGNDREEKGGPGSTTIEGVARAPENVSAETSRRIACDASRVVMTHDDTGHILDVGRKTRAVSPALRRALEHRDGGCRFPGCDLTFCDAHHVEHWADGGETKLDNLVLLCRRHHRCVHEEGYGVELNGDGSVRFLDPNGREIPDAPAPPPLPERPVSPKTATALLAGLLDEVEVEVDPRTSIPDWDGRAFDLHWALNMLLN